MILRQTPQNQELHKQNFEDEANNMQLDLKRTLDKATLIIVNI